MMDMEVDMAVVMAMEDMVVTETEDMVTEDMVGTDTEDMEVMVMITAIIIIIMEDTEEVMDMEVMVMEVMVMEVMEAMDTIKFHPLDFTTCTRLLCNTTPQTHQNCFNILKHRLIYLLNFESVCFL